MTALVPLGEITPARFAEVGRPSRTHRRDDGRLVALCSAFDLLYWPGRAIYDGHRLRYRISLYSGDLERRIAVLDAARFPIHDVAFHPTGPWLAVGAGSYDGGYAFEGELLLWNWETGEVRSLLRESREVVACRFVDPDRLAVLLRPPDDDQHDADHLFGLVIDDLAAVSPARAGDPRLVGLTPIDPASLGFVVPAPSEPPPAELEPRHRVWDVAWIGPDLIAAVHDRCHLEVWSLPARLELDLRGPGHGIQLLRQPDQLLVHVLQPGAEVRSTLYALRAGALVEWRSFDRACACSVDRRGRILARDTRHLRGDGPRLDRILDENGALLLQRDLGSFDCFNHPLRIDGGEELYLLRGAPPSSHQGKRVWAIDAGGAEHDRMRWDDQPAHLMDGCAVLGPDRTIVRGYRVYHPHGSQGGAVERRPLGDGPVSWRCPVDADVTALVVTPDTHHVVFATTAGRLAVVEMSSGRLVHDEQLAVDGVATFATALAVEDRRLVAGTIDGRLLLYAL